MFAVGLTRSGRGSPTILGCRRQVFLFPLLLAPHLVAVLVFGESAERGEGGMEGGERGDGGGMEGGRERR